MNRKDAAFGFMFGVVGGAVIGLFYGKGVRQRASSAVSTRWADGKLNIEVDAVEAATPALVDRLIPR